MSGHADKSEDAKAARRQRLAEALRANLKRRKAQQRERSATGDPATVDADSGAPAERAGDTG